MSVTDDPVALNQWIPCAYPGQVAPGAQHETQVLGQKIRLSHDGGSLTCHEVDPDGAAGRRLPLSHRFEMIFVTLGDAPRPLPEIPEFDEPDRKRVNCGSVGVNTSPYRIVENFLDMAHFGFVHTGTLGAREESEVRAYKVEHRKDVDEVWATDCTFFQPAASTSAAARGEGQLTRYIYRVLSPFSVMLYKNVFGDPERMDAICAFTQPMTETSCIAYMPMALVDDVSAMSTLVDFQQSIFLQDRIILENQRPRLFPLTAGAETPTKADLSSIAYRRWLKSMGIRFGTLQAEAA